MNGLHPADIVVLVLYLAGITALGIWMARRVRNLGDFFMPRRFGKAMMITHAFGTGPLPTRPSAWPRRRSAAACPASGGNGSGCRQRRSTG